MIQIRQVFRVMCKDAHQSAVYNFKTLKIAYCILASITCAHVSVRTIHGVITAMACNHYTHV